ncbi:protein yippee-like At4g27740 isoform X2 [Sesamum indicum]|uniref:Protein yippee-like At4g27740 isoform X2 n=1 Tax=Sesamum indicum TaxID=4182 RepID=A0A8M8UUB1_SESIN|nr:protein yippee-like At4g27740 isoform X2 [Sesamum indicum]
MAKRDLLHSPADGRALSTNLLHWRSISNHYFQEQFRILEYLPMGRIIFRKFNQRNPEYLMCKECEAPLALPQDFHCMSPDDGGECLVFRDRKIINVVVDDDDRDWQVGSHKVLDISCVRCREVLGYKYIRVDDRQHIVQNGMVNFKKEMVQRRHGNQIIDGEAAEAVQIQLQ